MKLAMYVLLFILVGVAADIKSDLKGDIESSCEKYKQSSYASTTEKKKKCSKVSKYLIQGVEKRDTCQSGGYYEDWKSLLNEIPPLTSYGSIILYSGRCMQNFVKNRHTGSRRSVMLTFPGFVVDDRNLTVCSEGNEVLSQSECQEKSNACQHKSTTKRFWEATSQKFVRESSDAIIHLSTQGFRINDEYRAFCQNSVLAEVEIPELTLYHRVSISIHVPDGKTGACDDDPSVIDLKNKITARTGITPACSYVTSKSENNPCAYVAALGRAASTSSYNYENKECPMDSRGVVNQVATAMLVGNMILSLIKP